MILFLGIMVFIFNSLSLYSQSNSVLDSLISYKAKNISLYEGLNEIGDIVGFDFSYNPDLFASKNKIKANYENIAVNELLTSFINDTTICFYVSDKQIIIRKKDRISTILIENKVDIGNTSLQINGTVYNRETGDYLPFANISIFGKSIGTITNDKGKFNLKLNSLNYNDTLVVSFIGYKNAYLPISQLSKHENSIYLLEDLYKINEVIIRAQNAKAILKLAIENIKDNYYTDPYYITSFYREIVSNKKDLAAITESVLKVYKSPYLGLFSDQIKLEKSRKNEFYSSSDTVSLKLQGGLHTSLFLDIIKNPTYFLNLEHSANFKYKIVKIVNFDNSSAYQIHFQPKLYLQENSFEGYIYINTDNLAIVAVDFNITQEAINKIGRNLVVKKSFRTNVKPISVNYLINYRKINGKYFMNMARGELYFKVKYRKKLFATEFKTVFEFAVNNIDTIDVKRFDRIETISSNNVFINEEFKYDNSFWGDYNYISPNETLEDALIRIEENMKRKKNE